MRRSLAGALIALGGIAALSALMFPFRSHLSVATTALVLVVPVVVGAAVGGFPAGVVAVAAGFLVYDVVFIPPYYTLSVGAAQNWVALIVYVVVMLVVARVVAFVFEARAEAHRREDETRRLFALSDLLISDKPLPELLDLVVSTMQQAFDPEWTAMLLPEGDGLAVAATAGRPLTAAEEGALAPVAGRPQSLGTRGGGAGIVRVALTAKGRPIGLLALSGAPLDPHGWELLRTYANQAALALERGQLREQAMRAELLEAVDRWREALMGAVSHDLRTPLASVKTAVSTLRTPGPELSAADREELLELIETQSDSLARLVTNLLDMTRIQAGGLVLQREVGPVADVVDDALRALGHLAAGGAVAVSLPPDLPPVDVDQVLMVQVLANLAENALRHSPEGKPVEIGARTRGGLVELSVRDHGPGIPAGEEESIFLMFNREQGSGRAGLGLTIARAFVEAHGQTLRVERVPDGGARFVLTMPRATVPAGAG